MECLWAIADTLRNSSEAFRNRALPGALDLEQIPELATRGIIRLKAFMRVMDTQLSNHQFLAGDEFSVADITAFVSASFAHWIKVEIPQELVHLQRWYKEIGARPAIARKST
jgi:glutathione S-transferase